MLVLVLACGRWTAGCPARGLRTTTDDDEDDDDEDDSGAAGIRPGQGLHCSADQTRRRCDGEHGCGQA
jgi:hypothetical protein